MTKLIPAHINPNELIPHHRNARKHSPEQIDRIVRSIEEYGFVNPIIVKDRVHIIAGHARQQAALKLKLDSVPTIDISHLNERQTREYMLADNRLAELSEWDEGMLKDELRELFDEGSDLSLIGFEDFDIDVIDSSLSDNDDSLPEKVQSITQPGDIWVLGDHRLICGDSRDPEVLKRLLGDRTVDLLVTDPPYGVNYSEEKSKLYGDSSKANTVNKDIANDNISDYRTFFNEFLSIIPLSETNSAYVFMSDVELHTMRLSLEDCKFHFSQYLLWTKNHFVLSRKDFHSKHEVILYGWKGKHKFYGGRDLTTILEFDKPESSDLHPTMKPVMLIEFLIEQSSKKGDLVYDAFTGSGTTLIAAHNHKRIFAGCEIDTHFVDVAVKRWEEHTGLKAQLEPRVE